MSEAIQAALVRIPSNDFKAAAQDLLAVLGYRSERTLAGQTGAVADFIAQFPAPKESTRTEQAFCENIQSVRLVFQVTSDEIASVNQPTLGFEADSFDKGQQQSFMFFAVELKGVSYARGQYAQFTREINKRLSQPTVVLLKNYDQGGGDSYYRTVLQNLFFATLNTEIDKRGFSTGRNATHRNFSLYRYKREISDPDALLGLFAQTPFINGGLFDCLDSEEATGSGGYRVDCFRSC